MREEWTHHFKDRKLDPEIEGGWIEVEAGLHRLEGNSAPYFSVTGATRYTGGQITEDVLAHWPELAPVVRLHLSDDDGAPMHTLANGLYFLGFGRYTWDNGRRYSDQRPGLEVAADHFRVSVEVARMIRDEIRTGEWRETKDGGWQGFSYDADRYKALVDDLRPRWKEEAEEAKRTLDAAIAAKEAHVAP